MNKILKGLVKRRIVFPLKIYFYYLPLLLTFNKYFMNGIITIDLISAYNDLMKSLISRYRCL